MVATGWWRAAWVVLACAAAAGPAVAQPDGGPKRGAAPPARSCEQQRVAMRPADAAGIPALRPGRAVCLRLSRGQEAFFRVAPEAGDSFSVVTRRLAHGTDTVLAALDARGRVLQQNDDGGGETLESRLDILPGVAVALVRAGTLDGDGGVFELLLTREPVPPPPDFPTSPQAAAAQPPLADNARRPILLRRGQSAFFALPADRARLVATTRGLRRDTDTVLALLDADGNVLAEDDDGGEGFASELLLDVAHPGPLFLRAGTLDDAGGSFDLVLQREPPAPPPDFPTTLEQARAAGPLAADTVRTLRLGRRQSAVFALPAGPALLALTRELDGDTDTVLTLLDEDGATLAEDDDGGGGFASRLTTARANGRPAFLRAGTLNNRGGAFTLALRPLAPPGAPATGGPAATVAEAARRPTLIPGEAVALQLEADQPAVFGLPQDGRAGVALTFDLREGADTVLEMLDADGTVLDQNDDADGGLGSRLSIGSQPRPAFLRVRALGSAAFSVVLVRAAGN